LDNQESASAIPMWGWMQAFMGYFWILLIVSFLVDLADWLYLPHSDYGLNFWQVGTFCVLGFYFLIPAFGVLHPCFLLSQGYWYFVPAMSS
jgi:hypothetical protein